MLKKSFFMAAFALLLTATCSYSQPPQPAGAPAWPAPAAPTFNPAALVKVGDVVRYGSYEIFKIGEGIFQLKDQGDPRSRAGGLIGADMYLVLGTQKALLIDLGNNYISGYTGDVILPRKNAAEELHTIVDTLVGKLPLEITLTHMHPDHDGMTAAFSDKKYTLWAGKGENMEALRIQHGLDPAVYTNFDHDTKLFDLGGGRVLKPLLVRGHSNGCAVYILKSENIIFTGDCLGIGAGRSLSSAESLRMWASDTARLVDYIKANFAPFDRYALKVFTGHAVENVIPGFISATHGRLDLSYLDWRFLQDQALCGAAILKGQWLIPDSGLRLMEIVNSQNLRKVSLFTYGIGAVEMPLAQAYIAAGIQMVDEKK